MFEPWVRLLQSRNPSDIWVQFQSSSSSFCTTAHQRGNQVVKQWSEPENICFTPFKVIWSEGKAIAIDLRKLSCFYQNDHCQCWNNTALLWDITMLNIMLKARWISTSFWDFCLETRFCRLFFFWEVNSFPPCQLLIVRTPTKETLTGNPFILTPFFNLMTKSQRGF